MASSWIPTPCTIRPEDAGLVVTDPSGGPETTVPWLKLLLLRTERGPWDVVYRDEAGSHRTVTVAQGDRALLDEINHLWRGCLVAEARRRGSLDGEVVAAGVAEQGKSLAMFSAGLLALSVFAIRWWITERDRVNDLVSDLADSERVATLVVAGMQLSGFVVMFIVIVAMFWSWHRARQLGRDWQRFNLGPGGLTLSGPAGQSGPAAFDLVADVVRINRVRLPLSFLSGAPVSRPVTMAVANRLGCRVEPDHTARGIVIRLSVVAVALLALWFGFAPDLGLPELELGRALTWCVSLIGLVVSLLLWLDGASRKRFREGLSEADALMNELGW